MVHHGATWRIRLSRPYAAAMRPYIKFLWPLIIILIIIYLLLLLVDLWRKRKTIKTVHLTQGFVSKSNGLSIRNQTKSVHKCSYQGQIDHRCVLSYRVMVCTPGLSFLLWKKYCCCKLCAANIGLALFWQLCQNAISYLFRKKYFIMSASAEKV